MNARPITAAIARRWVPVWPKAANKGERGRVMIVAGSRGMIGAAVLSSIGAVRSGAGLVRLLTVASQQRVAASRAPLEVMTSGVPEAADGHLAARAASRIRRASDSFRPRVIAAGPGLGTSSGVRTVVRMLLNGRTPLVLDADGLNAFAGKGLPTHGAPLIITPHPGELSRLIGWSIDRINAHRVDAARLAAERFHCVCLLKGAGTIVTDGRRALKNTSGNAAMASGGMGDVLTGIIAALWAQMRGDAASALNAAALGAFVHGRAADIGVTRAARQTLLASDLAGFLSSAFKSLDR